MINMNNYIDTVSVNCSDHDKYKVKTTTFSEIKACIGILYMAVVFKSIRQNLDICGPMMRLAWRFLDPQ
jgi:hypothetical protein